MGCAGYTALWARLIDSHFKGRPATELAMVMIIGPVCLNATQFWILDAMIKLRHTGQKAETVALLRSADKLSYSALD